MRCECCNVRLSVYESSLKHPVSQAYHDTCLKCLKEIGLPYTGNVSLEPQPKDDEDSLPENWDYFDEWEE